MHEVKTAFQLGWHRLQDHQLLPLLQSNFDVVVTIDQGWEFQHNLTKLNFGFVIVHVSRNKVEFYRPLFDKILEAVELVKPGHVIHVSDEYD